MSVIRKLLGPKSKYDPTIPYTYMAEINVFPEQDLEPLYVNCYSDTLCGLVEYLAKYKIDVEEVELYEVTQKGEEKIKKELCLDSNNTWLSRPEICHSLEGHYKGHIDEKRCSYRDRSREGGGLV
ncbi:hypothetical protein ACFLU5_06320 [Bacteroidota bacterium]